MTFVDYVLHDLRSIVLLLIVLVILVRVVELIYFLGDRRHTGDEKRKKKKHGQRKDKGAGR